MNHAHRPLACTANRRRGPVRFLLVATVIVVPQGFVAAAFEAVGIEVFPPRVQLDSAGDRQRIVVQARAADGRTRDVTAEA